jgi:hypothetical protein
MSISKKQSPSEGFEDRNVTSAVCRSTPNGLNDLNKKIDECSTSTEINRRNDLAETSFKLKQDIEMLRAQVGDSLLMGDSIFGTAGIADITNQVKARNIELKTKKDTLRNEIDKQEAIIERSNRDFSDVKDTIPEPQPKKMLRFIEDYTLAFLVIAYLFMIIAIIYTYTILSEFKGIAFIKAVVSSIFLSIFLFMILQYLS